MIEIRRTLPLARTCLWLAALVPALALVGWVFDKSPLTQVHSSFAAMVPSTAICLLLGVALVHFSQTAPLEGKTHRRIRLASIGLAVCVLANVLWSAGTGSPGLDRLLLPDNPSGFRMSIGTGICFLYASIAIFTMSSTDRASQLASSIFGAAGLFTALGAFFGHLISATDFYMASIFAYMSLPTSTSFILLFSAILGLRKGADWMDILSGGSRFGDARLLTIPVLISPILLSTLTQVWHAGTPGTGDGNVFIDVTIASAVLFFTTILARKIFKR